APRRPPDRPAITGADRIPADPGAAAVPGIPALPGGQPTTSRTLATAQARVHSRAPTGDPVFVSGHAGSGSGVTGGGRQIVIRPAPGCGSRLEGQAAPGVRASVSGRGGGGRPGGRR